MAEDVMELVAFLKERLDEDERVAKTAHDEGLNNVSPYSEQQWCFNGDGVVSMPDGVPLAVGPFGGLGDEIGQYIACWDPKRVLAEVEAKREILKIHESDQYWPDRPLQCKRCSDVEGWNPVAYPCPTVRALAQPYVDRPDFNPAWVQSG